ncbi:MAG: hypothetical protein ACRYGF_15140 [Janthinobacterium lividum]
MRLNVLLGVFAISSAWAGPSAQAQVFELSGGVSTLYDAKGGAVVIHGRQTDTTLGAGMVGGHFAMGATSVRGTKLGTVSLGQQEFRLDLPTDVFDGSHLSFGTGLGLHSQLSHGGDLKVFGGVSSADGGTPLFRTTQLQRFAGFARLSEPVGKRCTVQATGFLAASSALLGSAECSPVKGMRVAGTLGFGSGAGYAASSIAVKRARLELEASYVSAGQQFQRSRDSSNPTPEPVRENIAVHYKLSRHYEISGLHQNYLTQQIALPGIAVASLSATRSALNMLGLQFWKKKTGWHVSWLESSTTLGAGQQSSLGSNWALSAGFAQSLSKLRFTEDLLYSTQARGEHTILFISAVAVPLGSRLTASESMNVSGSGVTFSHGGTWLTSRTSTNIDYRLLYLASRPDHPFQQVMSIDAGLQVFRGLALHVGSSVSPTGKPLYTFQLGKVLARSTTGRQMVGPANVGVHMLQGRVEDADGKPIEGAVLLIGAQRVYTDAQGMFVFREDKSRTHPLRILADEFLTLEDYVSISSPSQVTTSKGGSPLRIVVGRKADIQSRQLVAPSVTSQQDADYQSGGRP